MAKKVGSIRSYTFGFVFSLVLTIISYFIYLGYTNNIFSLEISVAFVMSLAVLQLVIQLIFFLHLGHDKETKWKLGIFVSAISVILLIVIGSIWIMYHLDYNMMPQHVEEFIIHDEGMKME